MKMYTTYDVKFKNILELSNKMMSIQKLFRPDCKEILEHKDSWALSKDDILKEEDLFTEFSSSKSKMGSFSIKFLKTKLNIEGIGQKKQSSSILSIIYKMFGFS